jgi:integrase/recombinase XerC
LRDYLAYLAEQGVAKTSIARKLSAIRSFYHYLVREEIIDKDPIANTASPKLDKRLPDFLTIEEAKRLVEAPDLSTPEGQRDRAILELLYAGGVRVSELVKLNLEQVNLDGTRTQPSPSQRPRRT